MSYKVCPKCEQHRPVEEVLCQTPETNDICGWDLTQESVVVPTSEASRGPIKSLCPNGHAIRPGDLLCGECNAPIEYPQERESAGPGPGAEEGPQPDYDAGPTTRINGWEVLSRVSASGAATEVFHVRHEGRGDGILTLWGCGVKPDPTVYDALPGLEPRPAAVVLERGNVEGRAFEVVSTSGTVSLAEIAHDAWQAENIRAFVAAAASSLHAMGRGGIRHRDIRPEALLIGGEESTAVAICRYGQARLSNRDLDTAVPSELTRYTAPECLAGAVTPAADWWSFGIVLLERLTKGSCFEGVNDQAYLMSVVAHGVELPASIPEDFALLLRGLLFRDRAKRWQWAEVEAWLRGEPIAAPSEPQARDTTDVAGFVLGGRSYRRPALYALAAAQPENWVEAREQLVRGQVTTWLEELKGGERMRAALRTMLRRDNLDDDTRLAIALKVLNPDMPLVLSGHIVTPNWLLAFPSEAYRLISGEAPELLQQLGFEPWLTSLKQRLDQVRKRAKLHEIELNEDMLRIQALCTSRLTLDDQWEAQRRLSPDSEHKGLTALMDRRQLSDEDLVLLLSAGKGQFTPLHELVRSAAELARREGVTTFNEEAAVELFQLPRREVLGRLNERIENFSRCGKQRLDEWADQYRLERRINLPRAAVILSVAKEKWRKPPKQDYVAKLLDFFEKRITASVSRGALARMTITRTSPRIDLTEFGTARVPASALLDQLLERSDATLTIDPSVFGLDSLLERRLRTLVSRADLLRRDTGINGLYLGFPFVLVQPRGENVKPRIAPVLLWPIRIGTEVGQRARFTVAFDRDREEVRLNPALQNVFSPEEVERWKGARDSVLSGSTTAGTVMDQFSLLTQRVRQSDLARLPSADVKVVAGTTELTSAAVFFHVTFVGQAIVEDIRQLKAIPPKGTGLEALLRVQEAKPKPVLPTPAGEGLDRYTTADSDPTQDLAVLQSRTAPGLVVEGPPGTGKSQTIVNLVADAIGRKKSILIVCQKQAALDVVFKRLQREGLDDRLMLVRDESKDRRTVIQAVRDQVTALFTNGAPSTLWVRQRKDVLERIKRLEDQLNAHQDALHRRDEVSGLTYREIVGELISVEEAGTLPDVLELRKFLAPMEAEPVQAAREACSNRAMRRAEAERVQREKQQGLGKPIISAEVSGHRVVAVGNTVYTSNRWKTFHDFLRQYLISQLGADWFKAEQAKAVEQRHPIVRWYDQAIADAQRNSTKVGEVYTSPMTGAQRAFLNLAYNIYLIAHHAKPEQVKELLPTFIDRLKSERADDFIGKLFETYAAAAFLKAGFELSYEDESDKRTSHVEFVAMYTKTGRKFSVEVKTRNRAATEDGPVDDIKRLRVASKLNRALAKKADHTRVVMIEVNVPDVIKSKDEVFNGWPKAALAQIRDAETKPAPDGGEKPSAYVVATNHAFHNNLEAVDAGSQVITTGFKIADFGPDVPFNSLKAVLESEQRHQEIFALIDSMRDHYEIPSTFNGENPELAFQEKSDVVPPLRLGEWYAVPGPDGKEVPARLMDALVDETKKSVMGVYQTDKDSFMVTCPLSDAELDAWKRHPDTFFGEVRQNHRRADNWLELAKFFYETYQHTPREKLLEWMKGAVDYEKLATLSQEDLALVYCERTAWAASKDQKVA